MSDWQLTKWEKIEAYECYDVLGRNHIIVRRQASGEWELHYQSNAFQSAGVRMAILQPSDKWAFQCPDGTFTLPAYETPHAAAMAAIDYLNQK